jgi:hypothetical protein
MIRIWRLDLGPVHSNLIYLMRMYFNANILYIYYIYIYIYYIYIYIYFIVLWLIKMGRWGVVNLRCHRLSGACSMEARRTRNPDRMIIYHFKWIIIVVIWWKFLTLSRISMFFITASFQDLITQRWKINMNWLSSIIWDRKKYWTLSKFSIQVQFHTLNF